MLRRQKSYNAASLVEDVITDFESYYKHRLLDHANGRCEKHRLLLDRILSKVTIDPNKIIAEPYNIFLVPSESVEGKLF